MTRTPLLFATLTLAALLLGSSIAEPVRRNTLETVSESVLLLKVNGGKNVTGGGLCTGWMYTDTQVITAGHCADHLMKMEACFYPDFECKKPVELEFLGADHVRDVALFQLPKGQFGRRLPINPGPKRLGDAVYAVGYPGGDFNVGSGMYVRRRKAGDLELWDDVDTDWDQSTVAIAPGSSGGPLVNASGELIGMTVGHNVLGRTLEVAISLPVDVIREGLKNLSMGTGKTTNYGETNGTR